MNYYNDNEPYVCEWLKNLIAAGHLPPGDVDSRDIREIAPSDLDGYTQCHFFAGIGGWPLALQMSGYEGLVCWTGSCPCQPFSAAGNSAGHGDERHLWPTFFALIKQCRPPIVFGEQVASAVGFGWLDEVAKQVEEEAFAFGAAIFPSSALGAPHRRDRLYWVATDTNRERIQGYNNCQSISNARKSPPWWGRPISKTDLRELYDNPFVGNSRWPQPLLRDVDDGVSEIVGQLRAIGNAIVPQVAAEFIKAAMNG